MREIITAAAYIRVSTEEQLEYSPASQLKKIREYARHRGIFLDEEQIFIDEGISGRKAEKRPAFMKMIAAAKTKPRPFNMILVWKFSRFARSREDSIVYKSMLRRQCGIDVVSVSEQLGEDKTAILVEALLEAMDEYYSVNLAEEVKRGMSEKFSRGGVVSRPPFGYRMDGGGFVPDESVAPFVRMLFDDFLAGMGLRSIAVKLNAMGVRTSRGNPFENRTVEYILKNPVYIGKLRRLGMLTEGGHEPLVSAELFDMANAKLLRQKRSSIEHCDNTPRFMLRGLVRCSACGSALVRAGGGTLLQCCAYSRGQCSVSHGIAVKAMNEAVLAKLAEDLRGGVITLKTGDAPRMNTEKLRRTLIERERGRLERLREAFELGIDSAEEYGAGKKRVLERIAELETQESTLTRPAPSCMTIGIRELTALNGEMGESEKNLMLRAMLDSIVFDRREMTIRISYRGIISL